MEEKLEIVFNFDTTRSMYQAIDQVRRNLEDTVGSLFKELPNLKIGIGANGDYRDLEVSGYDTKSVDLTTNLYELTQFIRGANITWGFANGGECYELVLHRAQTEFNWSVNARKILVMIGDEVAHTPDWHENKQRLDWRKEASKLRDMGVTIHTIQALARPESYRYYEELARIGGGYHLELDQFTDILSLVNAIVYRGVSVERVKQYEEEVYNSGRMNRTLDQSFGTLMDRPRDSKGRFVAYKNLNNPDLKPVAPGRFQRMQINEDVAIRDFVEKNQLAFTPGKGFYLLKKSETIQEQKEVVLRDKRTGDMFSGAKAREMIGLPFGQRGNISPRNLSIANEYDIYVQSTSYNRKLKTGSDFLYEVDLAA